MNGNGLPVQYTSGAVVGEDDNVLKVYVKINTTIWRNLQIHITLLYRFGIETNTMIWKENIIFLTFFFIFFGLHLGGFPQDSNDPVVGAAHEDKRQDEDENLKVGKFENIFL